MARCGCGSTCNCVFLDGDCIDVVGTGTVASPYRPNLLIDPDPDNEAVCNPGVGLLVRTDVKILDTPCINLSGNGRTGTPLSAALTPSPDARNLLTCDPTGALVVLHYTDSDCINLSGFGTLASPFTAEPIISGDVGNVAECRATGFYVPATTMGIVDYRATLRDSGTIPTVIPATGAGTGTYAFINFDISQDVVGLATYIVSDPIFGSLSAIEVTLGGKGVYQIELNHPMWPDAPFTAGDIDIWLNIVRWDGGNQFAIATSGATRYTTIGGGLVNTHPWLAISRTIVLDVGDVIYGYIGLVNWAAAFPGATVSSFPTIGPGFESPGGLNNVPSMSVTKIGTA